MSGDGEVNYVALDQIQFDKIITEWTGVTRWRKNWGWLLDSYRRLDTDLTTAATAGGGQQQERGALRVPALSAADENLLLPADVMFWRQIGTRLT